MADSIRYSIRTPTADSQVPTWHLHNVSWLSMHSALPTCQLPFVVRSLQLVEVRPYVEEEEEEMLVFRCTVFCRCDCL